MGLFFRHDRQAVDTVLYGFPLGHERFGETFDGLQEVGNRNRLDEVVVATAFQNFFFVTLARYMTVKPVMPLR